MVSERDLCLPHERIAGRVAVGETGAERSGFSLLFAAGDRPYASDVERVLATGGANGADAMVSFRPEDGAGWLELLSSGLTFDLTGLTPGESEQTVSPAHRYGHAPAAGENGFEAITLRPGLHIAGGQASQPVVRAMAGLAATLALPLAPRLVSWNPAAVWMEPGYFVRVTMNWLSGGAFPALGLTALVLRDDGAVESAGLAYFVGQEIVLEAGEGQASADTAKLAVRLIDHLVRGGPVARAQTLIGPGNEQLLAEPNADGTRVTIRRPA